MDEDRFNMEVRKFLKIVGVTSQREIEKAVRQALSEGRIGGSETLRAEVTLTLPALGLTHRIAEDIALG